MSTLNQHSVARIETQGDIVSDYGQFGETEFKTSASNLSQVPTTDFSKYFYRYYITATADLTFTLGTIGSPINVGYSAFIRNEGTGTITVNTAAPALLATVAPDEMWKITAKSAPNTWVATQVGLIPGDMAAATVRRTTAYSITATSSLSLAPDNFTFDVTAVENDPDTIEHDNTNTERINIKVTGDYVIAYHFSSEMVQTIATVSADSTVEAGIFLNGSTAISGSLTRIGQHYSGSGQYSEDFDQSIQLVASLTAGDYITLRARYFTQGTATLADSILTLNQPTISVHALEGTKGEKGDPGSGSTITVEDEGTPITGTPHSTLNFTGSGVVATDAGSGVADITIEPTFGGSVQTLTNYDTAVSSFSTTSTSDTDVTGASLTTSSLPSGNYVVQWSCEFGSTDSDARHKAQILFDAITIGQVYNAGKVDTGGGGPTVSLYDSFAGVYFTGTVSGIHTIKFQVNAENASDVYIRKTRIMIYRIS